ncbi:MAG: hypothetical protein LQ340_002940 [Diploschistes diacapsis]|nr:MAG: hypothetical protein LQ340_002940 [Diploschistes diacapsis]
MSRLGDLSHVGGERIDAIEHCLAGISRLQKEVQDASSYIPSYDQRIYSEEALHQKLDSTRKALAPKSKFAFKSTLKKNGSAISLSDAAELAMQQRAKLFKNPKDASSAESSSVTTPIKPTTPPNESASGSQDRERMGSLGSFLKAAGVNNQKVRPGNGSSSRVRTMSFAASKSVEISSHSAVHIILPSSAAHATSSGSLTNLRGCIVDMSMPTATGRPFAGLAIQNVNQSLLVCGNVSGAAHITGVNQSVIVVSARQFRMHECSDCVVYLQNSSKPIIEDCHGIQFAPLPQTFAKETGETAAPNQWDQVEDFNWLRSEHSPNWSILDPKDRTLDDTWKDVSASPPTRSLEGILEVVGVAKLGQNC